MFEIKEQEKIRFTENRKVIRKTMGIPTLYLAIALFCVLTATAGYVIYDSVTTKISAGKGFTITGNGIPETISLNAGDIFSTNYTITDNSKLAKKTSLKVKLTYLDGTSIPLNDSKLVVTAVEDGRSVVSYNGEAIDLDNLVNGLSSETYKILGQLDSSATNSTYLLNVSLMKSENNTWDI